ncbi:cell wall protein DAN4 [Biomphalaria glabrata]|nr:cell wall protein DAN4 [Biomphalaria glabrata]
MTTMALILYILLLSLTLAVKIVQVFGQTENCPTEKDIISQGKCYTFLKQNLTWHQAKAACESSSMSLAEFDNKDEASYVVQNSVDVYWIGVYDLNNEHTTYAWLSSNKTANIDYWYLVPSYGENMCVFITWTSGPAADTTSCDVEQFYICMSPLKNNSASTTEISSITTASTTETTSITTSTTETPSSTTTYITEAPSSTTIYITAAPSSTTTYITAAPSSTTTYITEAPSITTTSTTETPPITTTSTNETPPITTTYTIKTTSSTTISSTERSSIIAPVTETATYKPTTATKTVFIFRCSNSSILEANFSVLTVLVFLLFI